MKLQGAMEVITKGTFDGPANENATRERMRGAVTRCSGTHPHHRHLDRARRLGLPQMADQGQIEGDESGEGRERGRWGGRGECRIGERDSARVRHWSEFPRRKHVGVRRRSRRSHQGEIRRRGAARAEARTVGGRRVATPQVPMPRLDAAAGADAGAGAGTAATPSAAGLVNRGEKSGNRR